MLKLAGVTAKDVVYDLGCGDGHDRDRRRARSSAPAPSASTSIRSASRKPTSASPRRASADKVKILNEDLFTTNISEATVVTLYLLQSLNEKLIPKLNKELKPGTRIVSQTFTMGDKYPPEKTAEAGGHVGLPVDRFR